MTKDELALLKSEVNNSVTVSVSELPAGYEGTLVYGYDCDRNTVHVYAKAGQIHAVTYNRDGEIVSHVFGEEVYTGTCKPSKRAYRQNTQYFFASLMAKKGYDLAITEGNENEESLPFGAFLERAKLAEDLKVIESLA
ncbi:hypothetical protein [Serratia sp. Se-RSBMAAmG]|uniref:hypothetical protein n=1 Tax=Serratia sp. Se-RSBMAAmG TaxID=3043305 RepID=UPI0024AFB23C|nr:hypothetical protein [Serratia sp. Se-RSBMAAmG]MDI6977229.1 hypothetical protein [Serratia sp. Se-RSBMAAmG]